MNSFGLYLVVVGGLPLVYALAYLVRRRRRQQLAARAKHRYSVFSIAARVAGERRDGLAQKPVRWPVADPDCGVIPTNARRSSFRS